MKCVLKIERQNPERALHILKTLNKIIQEESYKSRCDSWNTMAALLTKYYMNHIQHKITMRQDKLHYGKNKYNYEIF